MPCARTCSRWRATARAPSRTTGPRRTERRAYRSGITSPRRLLDSAPSSPGRVTRAIDSRTLGASRFVWVRRAAPADRRLRNGEPVPRVDRLRRGGGEQPLPAGVRVYAVEAHVRAERRAGEQHARQVEVDLGQVVHGGEAEVRVAALGRLRLDV